MHKEIEPPRLIVLVGEINFEMVAQAAGQMACLKALSNEPIEVHITSGGGKLFAGLALYDMLKLSPSPIVTKVFGGADSAASLIMQAGKTRLMAPNASIVIHPTTIEHNGSIDWDECERIRKSLDRNQTRYIELLAQRTGQSRTKLREWCKKSTTLSAAQALQLGFIDGIIGRRSTGKKRKAKQRTA